MSLLLNVVHILTCIFLVIAVLLQSGKGAELSTTLGGSSQTVFGSSGGANFVAKFTGVLAGIFMLTSIGLTIAANQSRKSIFEKSGAPAAATSAPMAPSEAPSSTPTGDAAPKKN